jgi:hypothetical protein
MKCVLINLESCLIMILNSSSLFYLDLMKEFNGYTLNESPP